MFQRSGGKNARENKGNTLYVDKGTRQHMANSLMHLNFHYVMLMF